VTARNEAQHLVLAAQERVRAGVLPQLGLYELQGRSATAGRHGAPDLGGTAAAERRDDAPGA
jgi:hypothetical protein